MGEEDHELVSPPTSPDSVDLDAELSYDELVAKANEYVDLLSRTSVFLQAKQVFDTLLEIDKVSRQCKQVIKNRKLGTVAPNDCQLELDLLENQLRDLYTREEVFFNNNPRFILHFEQMTEKLDKLHALLCWSAQHHSQERVCKVLKPFLHVNVLNVKWDKINLHRLTCFRRRAQPKHGFLALLGDDST